MLLRFGVANHYSVMDYCELSLIASKAIKDQGADLLTPPNLRQAVLPAVLVYGANASGKTTIFSALSAMRDHVVNSFTDLKPNEDVPRNPFALDGRGRSEPSRFDCDFMVDDTRYHYGFECSDKAFTREWLYSFPEGARRVLFDRDEQDVIFGKHLRGRNKVIESFMRPNSLFLSVAAQNAHPQLSHIYDFFDKKISSISCTVNTGSIEQSIPENLDKRVVEFMRLADTGIVDAQVKREELSEENRQQMEKLHAALASAFPEAGMPKPPQEAKSVSFLHAAADGAPVPLPFEAESRGTIRLLSLVMRAIKALDDGNILLVDELDLSLHTLLSLQLLSLFASAATNPHGAQLIATTHDTNILCSKKVRRDQIWFCEKNDRGETSLYPLTDIRTRNTDNIEKGYLEGRFGAVPFVGRLEQLFGDAA
jgi:hypothetical protein